MTGFTVEFKDHIESQWEEGMAWDGFGTIWGLDYITPLAEAETLEENLEQGYAPGRAELLHWSNLQPVFIDQNGEQGIDQNTL